jgi:hypothetical protein
MRMFRDPIWQVTILYAALTLLLAYPLTVHPASRVLSLDADTNLFLWALAWDTHAFAHHPFSIFDANIFYPARHTLAYSENFIGSAIVAAPVIWLTHNLVLAMNSVALLSCVLSGTGAFLLARAVGVSPLGATISGLVFAFSPPRFLRLDQLHLATVQWVPFTLAFFHRYLDEGRKSDLRIACAFFTLQALTSGHGAALLVAGMFVILAYRLALGEPIVPGKRIRDLGATGVVFLLPTLLILIPYKEVQSELQLTRELGAWTTVASSFLASPTRVDAQVLRWLSLDKVAATANAYLFPGYLPLLLAAAAFVDWRSRPDRRAFWSRAATLLEWLAVISVLIAFVVAVSGPIRPKWDSTILFSIRTPWRALFVFALCVSARAAIVRWAPFDAVRKIRRRIELVRHRASAETRPVRSGSRPAGLYALLTALSVWIAAGPAAGLWPLVYWLPGLNFIRVPSRFVILAVLGVAILAGIGFDRLTRRLPPRRALVSAALISACLVAEFAAIPFGTEPYRVEIPAVDRWLADQPTPFVIAEVPVRDEWLASRYMLFSTAHFQKTVTGYSGARPAVWGWLYRQLREFPDEVSLKSLSDLHVDYIVVHTDLYAPGEWKAIAPRFDAYRDRLELVHSDESGRVYGFRTPRSE